MKFLIMFWSSIWLTDAYAYLDPGTGSLVIQSVIASITGGLFLLKTYWFKIKEKIVSLYRYRNKSDVIDE